MPSIINAVAGGAGGLISSGDTSGALQIQTGGVTAITVDASQNVSFANTLSLGAVSATSVTASSVTVPTGTLYPLVSGANISLATTSFTGSTSGVSTTLTASTVTGTIQVGQVITGANIVAGTSIIAQVSGTTGGAGTYTLSQASSGTVSGTITVVGQDLYNIPSWAKRVTVLFNNISTGTQSNYLVQIGSGSIDTTGYNSSQSFQGGSGNTTSGTTSTAGFIFYNGGSSYSIYGAMRISLIPGGPWVCDATIGTQNVNGAITTTSGGIKTLSGAIDRVRITTVGGATFAAGTINLMWE